MEGEEMKGLCLKLLYTWADGLYRHQIKGTGDKAVDGAFICPACGRLHGRAVDVVYPFMTMYSLSHDSKWLDAAESLFSWSEETVSYPDGSYINDIDSSWRGITVFTLISFMDTLTHHAHLMSDDFRRRVEERAFKAASYLASNDDFLDNNVNYPISIALAMFMAGTYFGNDIFLDKSAQYRNVIYSSMTESGLLAGEGIPRDMISSRGCRSVDIAYNIEESIPNIARLSIISRDENLKKTSTALFKSHLDFMLPDGAWNDSFGTRVFKWTYWGSRTSDGAGAALMMLCDNSNDFSSYAYRNLALMMECTHDGLLYGGPDLYRAGTKPCIHHTFTHVKIPALILDENLFTDVFISEKETCHGIRYYPEIDTYNVTTRGFRATVTGYDWSYVRAGHISGGSLSMLHGIDLGPILTSSMAEYSIVENNNQQHPGSDVLHECLSLRCESIIGDELYSSINDTSCKMQSVGMTIKTDGYLCDADTHPSGIPYSFVYSFADDYVHITVCSVNSIIIIPVISNQDECISISENIISFSRGFDVVFLSGTFSLPFGERRIFNLVPGFQALKIEVYPDLSGKTDIEIRRIKK